MLESRMKLVLNEYDEYTSILEAIRELAKDYDLKRMLELIDVEILEFQHQREKWKNVLPSSTVKERLEAVEMESYIKFVKNVMHDFG